MKRNFVSVFLFLRFAENMSRYWGAFSGFTKFFKSERPTAQKQDKKLQAGAASKARGM